MCHKNGSLPSVSLAGDGGISAYLLLTSFSSSAARAWAPLHRMARATADTVYHMNEISEKIWQLQERFSYTAKSMLGEKPGTGIHNAMQAEMRKTTAEIDKLKASLGSSGQSAVSASKTANFMKNFGGKAVPVVCLVIDLFGEGFRYQEVDAKIEKGGYRP